MASKPSHHVSLRAHSPFLYLLITELLKLPLHFSANTVLADLLVASALRFVLTTALSVQARTAAAGLASAGEEACVSAEDKGIGHGNLAGELLRVRGFGALDDGDKFFAVYRSPLRPTWKKPVIARPPSWPG